MNITTNVQSAYNRAFIDEHIITDFHRLVWQFTFNFLGSWSNKNIFF
jgi:hypothetical protein